ncbi:integrase [Streptomyces sp. NPDC006012]|uniref:integrase n=1 Tax=Streptomyces sp. NPDC006012 TaxID=3364739 RepID=UPI0036AFBDE4
MTTSTAASLNEVPWPPPDTVVLRGRALHPAADTASLSLFRDEVWVTRAADVDNYRHAPSLHFRHYPTLLRESFKAFALAVLNHKWPAALLAGSPGAQASLSSLYMWVTDLRLLAAWMDERGIPRICDLAAEDLALYRTHVIAVAPSGGRRADLLHAVRVLWAYREHLPAPCRLLPERPWGDATARQLAGQTESNRYNKTPRINPDTMEALLAWSLRVLEDFGPDIRDAYREDRQLKEGTHPTTHFYKDHYYGRPALERVHHYLQRLHVTGGALPGQMREDGSIELAYNHLARILACKDRDLRQQADIIAEMARKQEVAIAPDAPLGAITGRLNDKPWRDQPIGLSEIDWLVRALRAAAFVTICYLSGMRPGEALSLRRGCLHQDSKGQFTLTGHASKGPDHEGDGAVERSWAVVSVVSKAVTMLESLTDSPLIFPPSLKRKSPRPIEQIRPLQSQAMNTDITAFIDWINDTFARSDGAALIPTDPEYKIHAARLRRTLAYFVVRRPGGLIAAALQYGHVRTKVTLGYAGEADTSWLDDLTIERLEMVIDQTGEDLGLLADGEHVSGPSAEEYRRRLQLAASFAGRVVDKVRNAERLLKSSDPSIYHGRGMTCVYRAESALCRSARLAAGLPADGPDESQCQSACTNLAYTDRDIGALRPEHTRLATAATDPLSPLPLRDRARTQAERLNALIVRHENTRPTSHDTEEVGTRR